MSSSTLPLTVIIVTKNEAHNIQACLDSVRFAREIIVFDSGSTDDTVKLCKAVTSQVFETDWPGDGPQKNRAITKATQEWILCLDADERVSPALQREIEHTLLNPPQQNGFIIPYCSHYAGKPIHFGDWAGEAHLRLFRKAAGKFTEDVVHCHAKVEGKIGRLQNKILHYPFPTIEGVLAKMNLYSSESALLKFKMGKRASLWTALLHGLWTFFRGYILKFGLLDGKAGFMLALSNAHGTYYRYIKLMVLMQNST